MNKNADTAFLLCGADVQSCINMALYTACLKKMQQIPVIIPVMIETCTLSPDPSDMLLQHYCPLTFDHNQYDICRNAATISWNSFFLPQTAA